MNQVKSKIYPESEELPSGSINRNTRQDLIAQLTPGDIIEFEERPNDANLPGVVTYGLIVRKIEIQELMQRYDEAELGYDSADLWEAYEETGGPWELLADSKTRVWWPR